MRAPAASELPPQRERQPLRLLSIAGGLLLALGLWSYWPTLAKMAAVWESQPDYSHGFLVPPLALLFLWLRRSSIPREYLRPSWGGLLLLAASLVLRLCGALAFIESVDGWSFLLWMAGAVYLLAGWQVLRWAAPALAFLIFMVPIPFSVERLFSLPLQHIATRLSSFLLQLLGQPALAEGNVIVLGQQELEVAQACSGLRIFIGILALAFAAAIMMRRAWWERAILIASALPVAVLANTLRIVITGLLYQGTADEAARRIAHDAAGWITVPIAASMFAGVLWYLHNLLPEVKFVEVRELVQQQRADVV